MGKTLQTKTGEEGLNHMETQEIIKEFNVAKALYDKGLINREKFRQTMESIKKKVKPHLLSLGYQEQRIDDFIETWFKLVVAWKEGF